MTRRPLNEDGFVLKFVAAIYNAILNNKKRALERAMQSDPQFRKIVADIEQSKRDLEQWVAQQRSDLPPERQQNVDAINKALGVTAKGMANL